MWSARHVEQEAKFFRSDTDYYTICRSSLVAKDYCCDYRQASARDSISSFVPMRAPNSPCLAMREADSAFLLEPGDL